MIGKQLLNYEIKSVLGEGGMGTVYLAQHHTINRKVAIKVLLPELAKNEEIRKRFKNEASLMAHLQHPNIVGLIDYLEQEDGLYLIMEYVDGKGLDELIKGLTQPLPIPRAIEMFKKVLSAFAYAHKNGIIHRDVKPSNILITDNDDVKVLDFGIAKLVGETQNQLTKTGTQMGTVFYMSPEQVKAEQLDQRSDIYSLGITFYEMLAGFCPYASLKSEYEVYNNIVKEPLVPLTTSMGEDYLQVWQIISKATQKNKEIRYKNCEEIIQDFGVQKMIQDNPIQEKFDSVPLTNELKKSNYSVLIAVSIVLLLVGSYFTWNYFQGENTDVALLNGEKVWVIRDELIFRNTHSANAPELFKVPFGSEIELLAEKIGPFTENKFITNWQKASYNGQEGWIAVDMDAQSTVGTYQQMEQTRQLWGGTYNPKAEYVTMRRWAQYEIRDFLQTKGWTGKYQFKSISSQMQKSGSRSILKYHFDNNFEVDERYDYVVLLESTEGNKNLAVFCKADLDGQGGIINGFCYLPNESSYFSYSKIESGNSFIIDEIYIHDSNELKFAFLNDKARIVYYESKYYEEEESYEQDEYYE